MNSKIALICEGSSEQAIMQVLLEHNALKFSKEDLLEDSIIRCRNGRKFAREYLGKTFDFKVNVCRILDSKVENFKIPKEYVSKVNGAPYNFITSPEIEILYILLHGDYQKYTNKYKSQVKPSEFVRQNYNDVSNVKSYNENYNFWDSHFMQLRKVLVQYKSNTKNSGYCIADLLR
ncbi:N-6 DNA methylase [Ligilactobacillus aviarius]|uniref:N-6 DNA methylase n=1 Tax=Candidatus Gallilactobacillus intestinavium TaxID=2840838 RepID=A0A9D9H5L3_9LACO|nr:N-6 DNA methylase [Ligilactobacillus aviarius]MBO8441930.1 N-6 DNA methylase [Candidatus Gallilactobacillus intestinavium]